MRFLLRTIAWVGCLALLSGCMAYSVGDRLPSAPLPSAGAEAKLPVSFQVAEKMHNRAMNSKEMPIEQQHQKLLPETYLRQALEQSGYFQGVSSRWTDDGLHLRILCRRSASISFPRVFLNVLISMGTLGVLPVGGGESVNMEVTVFTGKQQRAVYSYRENVVGTLSAGIPIHLLVYGEGQKTFGRVMVNKLVTNLLRDMDRDGLFARNEKLI